MCDTASSTWWAGSLFTWAITEYSNNTLNPLSFYILFENSIYFIYSIRPDPRQTQWRHAASERNTQIFSLSPLLLLLLFLPPPPPQITLHTFFLLAHLLALTCLAFQTITSKYFSLLLKVLSIGSPFAQSRSSLNQHLRPKTDPRLPRRRFFFEAHQLSPRAFLIVESFDPTFFRRVFSLDFSSGFCSL